MIRRLNKGRLLRWSGKGAWAVMDQALFAISNFALNVLLARWLTPADYGAFSVAYSLFLLLGVLHTAIFTEPMLIFGARKYHGRLIPYLAVLLRGHWLFGGVVALLFSLVGLALWKLGDSPIAPAILGLAAAAPFILFQWFMRRACYVNFQPRLAALSGGLYMLLMGAGILPLFHFAHLTAATAFIVMATASLASGLMLAWQLGLSRERRAEPEVVSDVATDHCRYGRWALATAVMLWVPDNLLLLLLPTWWGFEAAAGYRVVFSLLLPVMNVTTALGGMLLPWLVRLKDAPNFGCRTMQIILLFITLPLLYWLFLGVFGAPLLELLYGDTYAVYARWFWLTGLMPVLSAVVYVMGAALRALELLGKVFRIATLSALSTLTLGLGLVASLGVAGAFGGWFLAYAVSTAGQAFVLHQHLKRRGELL